METHLKSYSHRGGATISKVGYKYYCERSEQKLFGVVPPRMPFWGGGTTATNKGIRRTYRTALLQYLTCRARALIGL